MKPFRVLLVLSGALLAVCALILGLALTPSVQRWAVLWALKDRPGLKLELATVSAGFSGAKVAGLKLVHQGVPVSVERLEADFSPLGYLFGGHLRIEKLQVTGLRVDASAVSRARAEAAAAGAPAAAPGLLARIELPFDLTLGEVRIEGSALLPAAPGQSPVEATYTLTGGKFAAGQEGTLQFDARLNHPSARAGVNSLRAQAALRATITTQRRFTKVGLTTLVDAEGPAITGISQLKVGAEVYQSSGGENYEVTVSTLLQGQAENALIVRALLPAGTQRYEGEWALKARTAQFAPFVLSGVLPDFDAAGDGRFAFDAVAANFALEGGLQGRVSRLESLDPAWRSFGELKVEAGFDLSQQGGVLDVRRFNAAVAGEQPVLEIHTSAPVRYNLTSGEFLTNGDSTEALLRANLQGLPLAWVRPFVGAVDLSGGLVTGRIDLQRASGGAKDALVRADLRADELTVVREGRALLTKAAVTARVDSTFAGGAITAPVVETTLRTPGGDEFTFAGRFSRQNGQDAPLMLGGQFTLQTPKLLERWLPGAPVGARGELDFTLRRGVAEVKPGRVEIRQGTGRPLLELTLAQAFAVELATHALRPNDAARPVGRLTLGRVPLSALQLTEPGAVLGGHIQQGDFEIMADAGKTTLRPAAPLRLAEISLTQNRQVVIERLALEAQPVVEYAGPGAYAVRTGEVAVRSGSSALMTVKCDVVRAPGQDTQAMASFSIEVPALVAQPLFAGVQAVSGGRMSGEVRAVVGAHSQLEARMTLNGLVLAEGGQFLPVANIGFRGEVHENGAAAIQVPLLLDNGGRRSDLNFSLELSPLGRGYSVDGRLTGQQAELEDLLGVLAVFSAAAAPDTGEYPVARGPVTADTVAAWSRFSGRLALDVKNVTRGQEWAMTGLTGTVAIEPSLVALQKLEAAFSETSRLAARMELRFTGGPQPYRLNGDYTLNEFDAGRFFRAFESTKSPTVEGLFSITGRFAGNGETPQRAIDRVQGEFQLTSRQGVFRGLQRATGKLSMTSKAVELGASVLGSILGSDKAVRTAEKVAGQAYFVDQLAQSLGEFNYDLLSVKLSRDELLNMNLDDISLVSPEIRLHGQGSVSYVFGQSLLEQPLSASLNIAARGKVEQLLGKLRLLDTTKDELGYTRGKEPVLIGGTLAKPDANAFFTKMATSRIVDFLDMEN
ncbi:MAG: translocation and assembly module TamB [Verrucomicrobiota bacterium]|nr:translocation and assembly module TamB [Verrucomicrobiota bacterium]